VNVRELIEILGDYPEETEVEMGIIAPVTDEEQIAVDRYPIEGILPWEDDDEENGDGEAESVLWLIGGDEEDVEAFLDAIEAEEEPEAEEPAGEEPAEIVAVHETDELQDAAVHDEEGHETRPDESVDEPGPSAGA
jgi:hypothetical protein